MTDRDQFEQAGRPGGRQDLVVSLLDGFVVAIGATAVPEGAWRTAAARRLVKVLGLAPGHQLHREYVIDLLWPDLDPPVAAKHLRAALHVARDALEPDRRAGSSAFLVVAHDMLRLIAPDGVWTDVEAFRDAARACRRRGRLDVYEAAVDLYHGDLLPEDRYEDWAASVREELRETWLGLLVELGRLHEAAGEFDDAVTALERVTAAAATHEDAHAGLMRLHALAGRPGQALRQYARLRDALAGELDVDPMPATTRLHAEIASGRFGAAGGDERRRPADPAARAGSGSAGTSVPTPIDRFVGRGSEIAAVRQLLTTTRLLTLTGGGGCGKTRLAVAVAQQIVASTTDAVWFVELAATSDPALVAGIVGSAVGVSEQPDRPVTDTIAEAIGNRSTLLVVDNCEHLVETAAHVVGALLGRCPRLRAVVTSREPLRVAGEVSWRVPPLTLPATVSATLTEPALAALTQTESVALLVDRIGTVRPGFAVTADNAAALARICQRVDGIPLAVELAAARTATLSLEQLAVRLDDALTVLTEGSRSSPDRQRTLRATLDWSHALLDPPARVLFRRLAVFAGGWSLGAADAVAQDAGGGDGSEPADGIDVLAALTELVDKSMVQVDDSTTSPSDRSGMRYTMLETVRQYAAEQLVRCGEDGPTRDRHVDYFVGLAEAAERELTGPDQSAWLVRLNREHDNLRAGLQWAAISGDAEREARLCAPLWRYWNNADHLIEGDRRFSGALARLGPGGGTPLLRGRLMQGAAALAWVRGDVDRADTLSTAALQVFREVGDRSRTAATLHLRGILAELHSRNEDARRLYEEALELRDEVGDVAGAAATLQNLGNIARHDLDPARAASLYERSLSLNRAAGNERGVAISLANLGAVALDRGDFVEAERYAAESVVIYDRLRARSPRAVALQLHGFALLHQGHVDRAIEAEQSCLRIAAEIGDQRTTVLGLEGVAAVLALGGDPAGVTVSAQLFGAAEATRARIDMPLPPCDASELTAAITSGRDALDAAAYDEAWLTGRSMTLDAAIAVGLAATVAEQSGTRTRPASAPLTARELEIASLVADGLTNALIAAGLGIAQRTVDTHVSNVLRKLGVSTRADVPTALRAHPYT